MNRRLRTGSNAIFYSTLVFGSVVLVNMISTKLFTRIDLTENQVYTLSDASKQVASGLPDRLSIKAFMTEHQELARVTRYVRDLLHEYATAAGGKIAWEVLDPTNDPAAKQEATRMHVNPVRLQEQGAGKFSVQQAYLGVGLQYGGEIESIPVINAGNPAALEYQLTSLIKRMSQGKKKVAVTQGHGEPGLSSGIQALAANLDQYVLLPTNMVDGAPDEEADTMLVIGPSQPLSKRAQWEIDQFIMKGKSVAFLIDGMLMEKPRGQMPPGQLTPDIARTNSTGLDGMLKHYGASVRNDVVLDEQNAVVYVPVGPRQMMPVNYPGFPIVTDLDRDNPAVAKLQAIIPVFPSSIDVADSTNGATVKVLARTTPRAWRQEEIFLFDPNNLPKPKDERGTYALAVTVEGEFKSFFAGQPPPTRSNEAAAEESVEPGLNEGRSRIAIIGDSEFIRDDYLRKLRQVASSNFAFFANLLDWLAQDEALIALRSKTQTNRPLEQLPEDEITKLKYANVAGVPLALIVFGIVRWRFRRARRASIRLEK